jgi:hypothetical protein
MNIIFKISSSLSIVLLLSCNSKNDLGNNFSLLEGDSEKDRVIVYCSGRSFGECISGMNVVPTYAIHMENGKYAEYIQTAKSNDKWIIAESIKVEGRAKRYWIIDKRNQINLKECDTNNCDSILQTHVKGPMEIHTFIEMKENLKIDLTF